MHMAVDATGQNQHAGRVDDFPRRTEVQAERRDASVSDADVAGEGVGCGRDRPAANDRVEGHRFLILRLFEFACIGHLSLH